MRVRIATVPSLSLVALAGCASLVKGPDATLELRQDELGAVDRMTTARCDRSAACQRPETGNADGQGCEARLRTKTATDTKLSRCANRIDGDALDRCIEQIRATPCGANLDDVTYADECRVGDLCTASAEPSTI